MTHTEHTARAKDARLWASDLRETDPSVVDSEIVAGALDLLADSIHSQAAALADRDARIQELEEQAAGEAVPFVGELVEAQARIQELERERDEARAKSEDRRKGWWRATKRAEATEAQLVAAQQALTSGVGA